MLSIDIFRSTRQIPIFGSSSTTQPYFSRCSSDSPALARRAELAHDSVPRSTATRDARLDPKTQSINLTLRTESHRSTPHPSTRIDDGCRRPEAVRALSPSPRASAQSPCPSGQKTLSAHFPVIPDVCPDNHHEISPQSSQAASR